MTQNKSELTSVERARIVEAIALEIARHRMEDTARILTDDEIAVTDADRQLAFKCIRMSAPLHPIPEVPE